LHGSILPAARCAHPGADCNSHIFSLPWPALKIRSLSASERGENRGMDLPRSPCLHKISGKLVPAPIIPNSRQLGAWIQQHVGAFMTVGQGAEAKRVAGRVTQCVLQRFTLSHKLEKFWLI
jgi:hypothetical protein